VELFSSTLLLLIAGITGYASLTAYRHRNCLILVVVYFVSAWSGYFGIMVFDFARDLPFELGVNISSVDHLSALVTFFVSMFFFVTGFNLFFKNIIYFSGNNKVNRRFQPRSLSDGVHLICLSMLLASASIMFFSAYQDFGLIARKDYLPLDIIRSLKAAGSFLILIFLMQLMRRPKARLVKLFWIILISLLFISAASRMVIFPLAAYLLAKLIQGERFNLKTVWLFGTVTMLELLLVVSLRSVTEHGLLNYLVAGNEMKQLDMELVLFVVNYISSFSYALTVNLVSLDYSMASFWVSIDPRLGFMTAWHSIADQLRLNEFAPFNALSELAALGVIFSCMYFFVAGAIIALATNISQRSHFLSALLSIFVLIFVLYSLQYNLRSTTRFLYYILFVSFFTVTYYAAKKQINKPKRRYLS
jgi:hypothetical protein